MAATFTVLIPPARTGFQRGSVPLAALSGRRSVIPDGRYATKGVASDRHPADGRERQVSATSGSPVAASSRKRRTRAALSGS
jgi:hypothetical protein